ncbi:MAG: Undecaprenyl-phosphate galactose phosphotransferase WbaP [Lentimonas sp.]|jgi:Undecaprenyl-phosphate galactose phosphotransferase WbaP
MNLNTTVSSVEVLRVNELPEARRSICSSYLARYFINAVATVISDAAALVLSFELASYVHYFAWGDRMNSNWTLWLVGIWALGAAAWRLLPGWGLSAVESLRRLVILTCATFSSVLVALFLRESIGQLSGTTLLLAFTLAIPLIPFLRMRSKRFLLRRKLWGTSVAMYGAGVSGRSIVRRMQEDPGLGYNPVCFFDDDPDLQGKQVEGLLIRGNTDAIAWHVPVGVLAMPRIDGTRITELMEGSLSHYYKVMVIPNLVHTPWLNVVARDLSGTPGLELCNNLMNPGKLTLKRSVELALTIITLPLWGLLVMLVYFLISIDDSADPIFRQPRIGRRGQVFQTLKFRTMVPNAENVLNSYLEANPQFKAEWERDCKLKNDPRVTSVGRFLRKTSLDEIPQLINVLRGEMSLIGPRPLPDYHYRLLPPSVRKLRERVAPGMTGLWQVSGRSEAGNAGMVRWDPYYVRNWSLWLDIVILVRTFRVVVQGSGAH